MFFHSNEQVPLQSDSVPPSERVPRASSPAELPSRSVPAVPVPPAHGSPLYS